MEKIKKIFQIETINLPIILSMFIIACPILDMMSFLFRNTFGTNMSPSTIIRPIIPIIVLLYLFFKKDKKFKFICMGMSVLYAVYACIHLIVFEQIKTQSSYSGVIHEAQYIMNYSFMILNLFLYLLVFKKEDSSALKKSILFMTIVYVVSIFIAIITKTSSYTYPEEAIGYKGWFESGNSISSILLLSLFILFSLLKDRKIRKIVFFAIGLIAIFLSVFIGTRAGLFGFILIVAVYVMVEIIYNLILNKKINKKVLLTGMVGILILGIVVGGIGSSTVQRRKQLQQEEVQVIDPNTNEGANITGDLIQIRQQIKEGTLPENYMGKAEQESILELYDKAKQMNLSHTQMRNIQLIYHVVLVMKQANPVFILFGNGYLTPFRELVLEMEIPAFLFNFGIFGFLLYFIPFLALFIYGVKQGILYRKQIEVSYIMTLLGCGFAFALSFFSGYTFFNSSTMMVIIVLNALLFHQINALKQQNCKE